MSKFLKHPEYSGKCSLLSMLCMSLDYRFQFENIV